MLLMLLLLLLLMMMMMMLMLVLRLRRQRRLCGRDGAHGARVDALKGGQIAGIARGRLASRR
jgi:preprotein translocase subunit YajC